jgi:hypothetical protein
MRLATCRTPLDLWREQLRMNFVLLKIWGSIGLGRTILSFPPAVP